jgi:Co/Zn/Cd efflux system component
MMCSRGWKADRNAARLRRTPPIVAFTGMVTIWNAGIISTQEALAGFSNAGVLAVGVLFVVVQAVERSRLAPTAARYVFGLKTGLYMGLARMTFFVFILSPFLNNT